MNGVDEEPGERIRPIPGRFGYCQSVEVLCREETGGQSSPLDVAQAFEFLDCLVVLRLEFSGDFSEFIQPGGQRRDELGLVPNSIPSRFQMNWIVR